MLSAPRSSPAVPNPNGSLAIFTQSTYSFDTDSRTGGIHLLPLSPKSHESASSKLIINDTNAGSPAWLDDSRILYINTKSGESSLRVYNVDSRADDEVAKYPGAIGDLKAIEIDKDTIRIVFSAKVTPHGDIVPANQTSTPDVLVYDKLWVRHWDEWITPNKNTLLTTTLSLAGKTPKISDTPTNLLNASGEIHDLECPIPPWGGAEDFSLSKTHVAFVAKDPHLNPATNTAAHVYIVSYADKDYLEHVNPSNWGASSSPVWSPDGKYIAYLEMRVRGYEADRSFPSSGGLIGKVGG
jgi:dipeptidyl aminopeptidase/acylaminoacyl peptidase